MEFALISDDAGRSVLGESPVWHSGTNAIWWVDIDGRKLLRADASSHHLTVWSTPETPGFVVLTGAGQPAIGMQTGIFLFDPQQGAYEQLLDFRGKGQRFNDATVDPEGRLWASTMDLDAEPGMGAIHLVTPELELETVIDGLTTPNGMALDATNRRFYFSDSHPDVQTVWFCEIDPDTAALGHRELFADFHNLSGRPDGAALDSGGRYWIAGVDGSAIYVFDPNGKIASEIPVPSPAPTKPSFWGSDARSLALTSKEAGKNGGFLALGDVPEDWPPGLVQPHWTISR